MNYSEHTCRFAFVCVFVSVCVIVSVSPSSFFPACFLLILDSSALQGESAKERQGTAVTNCTSLLFWAGSVRTLLTLCPFLFFCCGVCYPAASAFIRATDSSVNTVSLCKKTHFHPRSYTMAL